MGVEMEWSARGSWNSMSGASGRNFAGGWPEWPGVMGRVGGQRCYKAGDVCEHRQTEKRDKQSKKEEACKDGEVRGRKRRNTAKYESKKSNEMKEKKL